MSNYATAASERTLREVIALLAAEASGTATGSACLCLVPNDTQHLAFCIDAREVEDVIHIVRSGVERAGKLLEPRSAGDYRARGSHFIRKSRLDLAIPAYSEAIRLDPGNNRAYFDRAMAYRAQRNFGLAIADFTHALRIEPQNSEMLDALAATYAEGGKFDEAVECQRKALAFAGAERKVEFESRLKQYEAHAAARSK